MAHGRALFAGAEFRHRPHLRLHGAALTTLQRDLGVGRADVSFALGLMLLVLGTVSPIVGGMLQRMSVRTMMLLGAAANCVGYVLLAHIDQLWQLLAIFAVLIGPGACMLGMIPASTLVSRWFERDPGKALAITNVPAFILLVPPIAAILVEQGGTRALFLALAGAFALLMPLLMLLAERPSDLGQEMRRDLSGAKPRETASAPTEALASRAILGDLRFWLLSLGVGIVTGAGTIYTTPIIPIATDRGVDLAAASLPLSAFGAGTIAGALIFGYLIDKFGPLPTLIMNVVLQIILWSGLALASSLMSLVVVGALLGTCLGALVALHSAAIHEVLGPPSFSRAMGYSYFLKVPFLFSLAPLGGYLYDQLGSYDLSLFMVSGLSTLSGVLFIGLLLLQRKQGCLQLA